MHTKNDNTLKSCPEWLSNLLSKFYFHPLSRRESFYLLTISVLIIFNFFISFLVRTNNIYYIPNTRPFGISFDNFFAISLLAFITWSLDTLNFFERYNLPSILLIVGVWSNFLEKTAFGFVADYVNLSFLMSYINLADVQIWVGLLLLNWQVWFLKK